MPPPPSGRVSTRPVAGGPASTSRGARLRPSGQPSTGPSSSPDLGLPPVEPWPFQEQSSELARKLIATLNDTGLGSRSGLGKMLGPMIRATLLDKDIFREVAADKSRQSEAWQVLGLVIVAGSAGFALFSGSLLSGVGLSGVASSAIIQLVAWLAKVFVVQLAATMWLKEKVTFSQLFRPLAYAQSPALLQVVPSVGQLIGLWMLVTNTAAIRDVTGFDTMKAAILSVIGVVGSMLAVQLVSPILQPLLRFF